MKTLYLLRGCPGSGKSNLAVGLYTNGVVQMEICADYYHEDEHGVYNWKPQNVKKSHEWCQGEVEWWMKGEYNIAVHNTFTTEKELKPYFDLAEQYGYKVVSLIVENRHGSNDIHNVPEDTKQKMKDRFEVKLL